MIRLHALCALALTAAACAAYDAPLQDKTGTSRDALTVCAGPNTVRGIDVSEWQGNIDWAAVRGSGVEFAITRINDGYHMDPYFAGNYGAISGNGMIRGAYQFFEPSISATWQANTVVNAVGMLGPGDLPVTLDVEWPSSGGTPNVAMIQTWVDIVKAGTGKTPMIYTAIGYWNQFFNGPFGDLPLWVANYGVNCPSVPSSWGGWQFWQWGGAGVPGIGGNVDSNVFNGTLSDLQKFANAITDDNCTTSEAAGCGNFGCGCVDHQCNGIFCPGSGCSAQHAANCGFFGCNCANNTCSGGFCPGDGCNAKETLDCQKAGCGCVDHVCSGGAACAGAGCTAKEMHDCGSFGCGCADHQCNGVFCPGTGCTAKETTDCNTQGCGCADHKCGGGKCAGNACTIHEVLECDKVDGGCSEHQCVDKAFDAGVPQGAVLVEDGGTSGELIPGPSEVTGAVGTPAGALVPAPPAANPNATPVGDVIGTCASAPGLAAWAALVALRLARRRRARVTPPAAP